LDFVRGQQSVPLSDAVADVWNESRTCAISTSKSNFHAIAAIEVGQQPETEQSHYVAQ
jgi:hypothetical protein